ncbi:MAG TPA: SBBP repeat-containing protein [Gemmataceae bacterium]|nr:SBBP repeat-containing protein [Gemmataceae bacterium]
MSWLSSFCSRWRSRHAPTTSATGSAEGSITLAGPTWSFEKGWEQDALVDILSAGQDLFGGGPAAAADFPGEPSRGSPAGPGAGGTAWDGAAGGVFAGVGGGRSETVGEPAAPGAGVRPPFADQATLEAMATGAGWSFTSNSAAATTASRRPMPGTPTSFTLQPPLEPPTAPAPPAASPADASSVSDHQQPPGPTPRLDPLSRLPLTFEANTGQVDAQVHLLSRGRGYTLFLTSAEAVLVLSQPQPASAPATDLSPAGLDDGDAGGRAERDDRPVRADVLRMQFVGANPHPTVTGLDPLPGRVHYFRGNDPQHWQTDIPRYRRVSYEELYPGVDLVFYGSRQQQLEYDFVVAPGADPGVVQLAFTGTEALALDPQGHLVLRTSGGEVVQQAPVIYQEVDGQRRPVAGRYVLRGPGQVGFQVGPYDPNHPLVIDPVLTYATYLGGSDSDLGLDIATDGDGNAYIAGLTWSADFPTAGPAQEELRGAHDLFVAKIDAAGTELLYATYLGGTDDGLLPSGRLGLAVDAAGHAYLAGTTAADDFPVTPGAFQTSLAGASDAFVTKLSVAGNALEYSTYLGGGDTDAARAVALDTSGQAYIAGQTRSTDFPTANPIQAELAGAADAFVAQLDAAGSTLVYATYLGGSANDAAASIAVDAAGQAYLTGSTTSADFPIQNALQPQRAGAVDAFVTQVNADGTAWVYSTYLGGSGSDLGQGIAVNGSGEAYVTGVTGSLNFPTTAGAYQRQRRGLQDAFVARLRAAGTSLVYATYLGGSGLEQGADLAVDPFGQAWVVGTTHSADFPTVQPFQASRRGIADAFAAWLNPTGAALRFATYLGGSQTEAGAAITVDDAGFVYLAGVTTSSDFPTLNPLQPVGGGGADAFVLKLWDDLPVASLTAPAEVPLGQTFTVAVTFDNASPTAGGYGPYLDLFLPATGADGDDGIRFVSDPAPTYLGVPVTATVLTFDAAGQVSHPYAKTSAGSPVIVRGTPGDQLVVLQLPFNAFTPDQPAATVTVTARLSDKADVGTPLTIQARGGFQFGVDPLDNPASDPSILGAVVSASVRPTLFTLSKSYLGPEDETATGPNFPRPYRLTVDVADGQTVTDLDLTDVLPTHLQFVSVDATTIRGVPTSTGAISTPSTTTPGGTLTRRFASVTGTTAADDAEMVFTFHAPLNNAAGAPVLDPATGASATAADDAKVQAN